MTFFRVKRKSEGQGRGNWGHAGRPGQVGGSAPSKDGLLRGEDRRKWSKAVYDMMVRSYQKIGIPCSSEEDMLANTPVFKVYFDAQGKPVAFTGYKETKYGLKRILSGTDGSPDGKAATIASLEELRTPGRYAELSDAPAHLANKAGIPKVPAAQASEILGKPVTVLDEFSYEREITNVGKHTKTIFGEPRQQPKKYFIIITT